MSRRRVRCPQCGRWYAWGATACPACHVGLELFSDPEPDPQPLAVFETADRFSLEIVVSLLESHGIRCQILGHDDAIHLGAASAGFWRVLVAAADESLAQEILDAEIGPDAADS